MLELLEARSLCSYGSGGATLELHLARLAPGLELTCTDFAPRTVERVAALFPEATVVVHDLRSEPPLAADVHLFHRVDTELSDEDWPAVFDRFRVPVLVAASELLSLHGVARELVTRLRHPAATRAGWLRTEDALRALWRASHEDRRVELHDLPGYLLTPR